MYQNLNNQNQQQPMVGIPLQVKAQPLQPVYVPQLPQQQQMQVQQPQTVPILIQNGQNHTLVNQPAIQPTPVFKIKRTPSINWALFFCWLGTFAYITALCICMFAVYYSWWIINPYLFFSSFLFLIGISAFSNTAKNSQNAFTFTYLYLFWFLGQLVTVIIIYFDNGFEYTVTEYDEWGWDYQEYYMDDTVYVLFGMLIVQFIFALVFRSASYEIRKQETDFQIDQLARNASQQNNQTISQNLSQQQPQGQQFIVGKPIGAQQELLQPLVQQYQPPQNFIIANNQQQPQYPIQGQQYQYYAVAQQK